MLLKVETWRGCYDDGWKGLIVDDAFCHPAKFAPGLIARILDEGLRRGWWAPGDVIGDPFAGIGTGGIMAAYRGLAWIGVELEPKFVALARRNFRLHGHKWAGAGLPAPLIVEGDSRRFAHILFHHRDTEGAERTTKKGDLADGRTDHGELCAVVTSPPYAEAVNAKGHGIDWSKAGPATGNRKRGEGTRQGATFNDHLAYPHTPGQIGRLPAGGLDAVVTSPPFAESLASGELSDDLRAELARAGHKPSASGERADYGNAAGQIGRLPAGDLDGVVTSPPYERTLADGGPESHPHPDGYNRSTDWKGYGATEGQIEAERGETYWQAVAQVYAQCRLAMKPGAVMAVIIKDYVKGGKRVPLCGQTLDLLMRLGFAPVARVRAMLVREHTTPGLFGKITHRKERKSFFRRLAERKGSPPIDWEEVLVVRAAMGDRNGSDGD